MTNVFALISLLSCGISIITGSYILHRKPWDTVNRLFFLFTVAVGYWAFTEFMYRQADTLDSAYFWLKVASFWTLAVSLLLHFSLYFTGKSKLLKRKSTLVLIYLPALIFSILDLINIRVTGAPIKVYWGWTYSFSGDSLIYNLSDVWSVSVALLVLYLYWRCYRSTTEQKTRKQIGYLSLGLIVPIMAGVITEVIFPRLGMRVPEASISGFAMGCLIIGYAIWKYELFTLTPTAAAEKIISTITDALILVDPAGKIARVNQSALRLLGYEESELVGQQIETILPPSESQKILDVNQRKMNLAHEIEANLRAKDGGIIPAALSDNLVRDNEGRVQSRIYICRDITRRKQVEDALLKMNEELIETQARLEQTLREAERSRLALLSILEDEKQVRQTLKEREEQYRTLVESMNEAVLLVDNDDRILFVNSRLCDLLGYGREELTGKTGYEILTAPEDREHILAKNKLRMEGGSDQYESRMRKKNGEIVMVLVSGAPVLDASGAVCGSIGVITDITGRKQTEQALREIEEFNREIIRHSPIGIAVRNRERRLIDYNKTWAKLWGMQESDIARHQRPLDDAAFRQYFRHLGPHLESVLRLFDAPGTVDIPELRIAEPNPGGIEWVSQHFYTIAGQDGCVDRVIAMTEDITERKTAEASMKLMAYALSSINDCVTVSGLDNRITYVNEAFLKTYGYERDEIIGRTAELVRAPGSDPSFADVTRTTLDGGWRGEIINRRKDGTEFPVALSTAVVRDGSGLAVGLLGVARDITERKRAEEAVLESGERFRSLIENTFIGVYRTTPDGKILLANPALVRMLGYANYEEFARRNLESEGYAPEYQRGVFKRLMETAGQMLGHEAPWKHSDGTIIWMRESARAIKGADGKTAYYEGTLEDITERKRAEERLERERQRSQNYLDVAGVMILALDQNGVVSSINRKGCDILGRPESDIVGRDWFEIFLPLETRADMRRVFQKMMAGESHRFEYYESAVANHSGETRIIAWHNAALYDEEGRLIGILSSGEDITQRKLMEQELQQAQKMEAIGQLAGGVAHDFNNMLAGIMGNAEMLYMRLAANPEQMELVERILQAGERAANLTKQLLSFARKDQYQIAAVDIHRSIGNVAGILTSTIDRRIRIKQSLRAQTSTIMGDPTQIENALMNLAINARDAMPEGGELIFSTDVVEIDLNYVRQHQYRMELGKYVMISVTDTGTGMDAEIRKHMFEPFFTTKEPGKGTGLGLASVYGIAKNHKGAIECYSEPGHGTVMKVYLPVTDAPEAPPPSLEVASVRPGTGSLLLVDDERIIREMASQMLKGLGYTVATCQDGQEAVDYYIKHHDGIDLVILDMIMPKLNGREAFLLMRQINPGLRALLTSGFLADGEAQEVLKLGILGFVQKPFRMAELSARIQEALG